MIEEWMRFISSVRLRGARILFVEDYDMHVASVLTSGVDVWINTPRRPWEACGTSGMKVLVNSGLNLSVLDGWWAEAYEPAVGWAIGTGRAPESGEDSDGSDAAALYDVLETSVVPEFFERDESGVPRKWVARMRTSIATLTPRFSGNRMLCEYVERHYLPLADHYATRLRDQGRAARELAGWQQRIARAFAGLRLEGPVFTASSDGWRVSAWIYLDGLAPEDVRLELYADPLADGADAERIRLHKKRSLTGTHDGFEFDAIVHTSRPAAHYTLRVRPDNAAAFLPLECPLVMWGASGQVAESAGKQPPARIAG